MRAARIFLVHWVVFLWAMAAIPSISMELGAGYGKQFRGNTNLRQYEAYLRQPLPLTKEFDSGLRLMSAVEFGLALIDEAHSDNDSTVRFLVMPQVIFSPHQKITCIAGLGPGFMLGDTEFTDHDLGGPLLLASKLGIQVGLGQHWNVGYFYFHQSNAGIYDRNASLNMHQLALSYTF